jgi:hypothetical protein
MRNNTKARLIILACLHLTLVSCAVELDIPLGAGAYAVDEMVDELEFTGYATIAAQSGDAALKRLMAVRASKLDAYRLAAEYVYGIYLDSNTTVGSLIVGEDEFSSRVEGVIMGAELVRVEPVSEDTYATTVALSREQIENIRREYIRSF